MPLPPWKRNLALCCSIGGGRVLFSLPAANKLPTMPVRYFQALDNICRKAEMAKGLEGGEVRIAAFRSVATHVLPRGDSTVSGKNIAAISISIDEKFHYQQVGRRFCVKAKPMWASTYLPTHDDFESWELMRESLHCFAARGRRHRPRGADLGNFSPLSVDFGGPSYDGDRQTIERQSTHPWPNHFTRLFAVREDSTILSMVERGPWGDDHGPTGRRAHSPQPAGVRPPHSPGTHYWSCCSTQGVIAAAGICVPGNFERILGNKLPPNFRCQRYGSLPKTVYPDLANSKI